MEESAASLPQSNSGTFTDSYDYLFKFLVIGSAGTGKSCLLHQFIEGRFKEDSSHTIGVEFGSKIVPVGGKTVKLQVRESGLMINCTHVLFLFQITALLPRNVFQSCAEQYF